MNLCFWPEICNVSAQELTIMDGPDSRRGKLPEIRSEEDTITFLLTIGLRTTMSGQLMLRCERDGEIYASIVPTHSKDRDRE